MCGIVGYVGGRDASPVLLDGLEKLEYRGYDSAGIAVMNNGKINMVKARGRLSNLVQSTKKGALLKGNVGVGHTRWATHGEPNDINSHPHLSPNGRFAVVHNGIIENYLSLRSFLTEKGYTFLSQTDTEVIAFLLEYYFNGDMMDCMRKVLNKLVGSYALGVLYSGEPDRFYAVRKDSPLVIGLGEGENFIASDMPALLKRTRKFILLSDDELTCVTAKSVTIVNKNFEPVQKEEFTADWDIESAEKGGFPHFMLKEIHEQPKSLRDTILPRIKDGQVDLSETSITKEYARTIRKINIIGCGSAYHAGIIGKYFIERLSRIPVEVDLASEFRYRMPIVEENTLTVIISQSGETADTLAGLRESKRLGSKTLAIVNVVGSSIAREADDILYTRAGPEIAVATTKGYTTQVAVLFLLGLYLSSAKGTVTPQKQAELMGELLSLPEKVENAIANKNEMQYLASMYFAQENVFFIGRGMDYASALEGALKLKEISYVHAEAYPAGELKHGTISLIEEGLLVIGIAVDEKLFEKTLSNVKEVRSRKAKVISLASPKNKAIESESDHTIMLPAIHPLFAPVLTAVHLQLFGYYVAVARGCDVDKPRNLAKSVTVE